MDGTFHADLVLHGGRTGGIALAGAVAALEERGYRFPRIAGASAGAVVGALVAAGAAGKRVKEVLEDLDFVPFREGPFARGLGPVGAATMMALRTGWRRGENQHACLSDALSELQVETFADLALDDPGADTALRNRPDRAYRFVAMASDACFPWTCRERLGLDPSRVRVAEAVRASTTVPFYVGSADAVDLFDRSDGAAPRWPTFGIKIGARPPGGPGRTIFVDSRPVRAADVDGSDSCAEALFEAGRAATAAFLDGDDDNPPWDFAGYCRRLRGASATPSRTP